jgi:hypothetical protein
LSSFLPQILIKRSNSSSGPPCLFKDQQHGVEFVESQLASFGAPGSLDPRRDANAMRLKAVTSSNREAYSHRFSLVAQLESCGKQASSCVRFSGRLQCIPHSRYNAQMTELLPSLNTPLELSHPASCGNRMVIPWDPRACLLPDDVIH